MYHLPRLGLAHLVPTVYPSVAGIGLMGALSRHGVQVQHFSAQAYPHSLDFAGQITGLPGRYLDPWLMDATTCRDLLVFGARRCGVSIVEGNVDLGRSDSDQLSIPAGILPLVDRLALPTIVVVPCQGWKSLHLTTLPRNCDAVILDGLVDRRDFSKLRRAVELMTGKPVLGAFEHLRSARKFLGNLAPDEAIPDRWIETIADNFLQFADISALRELAESRPFDFAETRRVAPPSPSLSTQNLRIAYCPDTSFCRYFPETLETLEAVGAKLVECSPLKGDGIPENVDVVLLGPGNPERNIHSLSANMSFRSSLLAYVNRGGRVYAQGGSAAYLCRELWIEGQFYGGVGVLPYTAVFQPGHRSSDPITLTLNESTWLGEKRSLLRGYTSRDWQLVPHSGPNPLSGDLTTGGDLVYYRQAVGSLIHLHPAALPDLLGRIAESDRYAYA